MLEAPESHPVEGLPLAASETEHHPRVPRVRIAVRRHGTKLLPSH